jgi:hypothetical protein
VVALQSPQASSAKCRRTMPKSRGEASLFWTKLCREEKPLGWKSILKLITHCQILNILIKKSLASQWSILLDPNFAWEAELLAPWTS